MSKDLETSLINEPLIDSDEESLCDSSEEDKIIKDDATICQYRLDVKKCVDFYTHQCNTENGRLPQSGLTTRTEGT